MTNFKNGKSVIDLLEKTSDISEEVIRKNLVDVKEMLDKREETTYSSSKNQIGVSKIKQTKVNIPINQELLNRYKNTNEMFNDYVNNYNGGVSIKIDISEL